MKNTALLALAMACVSVATLPGLVVAKPIAAVQSERHSIDLSDVSWKFKLGAATDDVAAPAFDDTSWNTITVPHTWNKLGSYTLRKEPDSNSTRGVGWYRLHYHAPPAKKGERQYLDFAGVSEIADVWVNGVHVGQHKGAFSRFRFDVTDAWKAGSDNVIAVKADNSKPSAKSSTGEVLPLAGDFFIYGGIYRRVALVTMGSAGIDMLDYGGPGVYAHTVSVGDNAAKVNILTRLRNAGADPRHFIAKTTIADANGTVVASSTAPVSLKPGTDELNQTVTVRHPHLWNGVDDPYEYSVTVTLIAGEHVVDSVSQPLGIRTFAFDANEGFSLNGHHLQLHGVARHQDREGKGWALSPQDHTDDMALIKEIGANTVRLAHYEHADDWLNAADAAGMVAWAEVPFVSAASFDGSEGTPATFANAEQQARELIRQDYNHPSIMMWSIGNEVDAAGLYLNKDKPTHPLKLLQDIDRVAKAEDPSRPTVFADCCEDSPEVLRDPQPLAGTADMIGYNRYYGWYYDQPSDAGPELDKLHAKHPNLPMAVSEYGAGGALSEHSDNPFGGAIAFAGRTQPEEYQSWLHEEYWKQIKSRKYLFATWVWNMFDFASDMRTEGDSVDLNTKGLIAFDHKTKKDAFWFYKASWSKSPVVFVTDKGYIDRAYPLMNVRVYSNAPNVQLTVNGKDMGSAPCPNSVCVWNNVWLKPGPNTVVAAAVFDGKTLQDQATWNGPTTASGYHVKSGDVLTRVIGQVRYGSDNFFDGGEAKALGLGIYVVNKQQPNEATATTKAIFATWRQGEAFGYKVPIPNGRYHITVRTFDPGKDLTPTSTMSIQADGAQVIGPFNIAKDAGGKLSAVIKSFDVAVTDGVLNLHFSGENGPAIVAAIDILPM